MANAGGHMLNADIWDIVAGMLRGDTTTLRECALTNSVIYRSMQRELFRTIHIPIHPSERLDQLVELLAGRPLLASYIRRLEVHGERPLTVLSDFARVGQTNATPRLACVRELRLFLFHFMKESLLKSLSGCFPSLVLLELASCYQAPLLCIPAVFPELQALDLESTSHVPVSSVTLTPEVPRLKLRAFTCVRPVHDPELWDISPFLERGLGWERMERLFLSAEFAPKVWPALRKAGTLIRHLFINNFSGRELDFLQVQLPLCGMSNV
jgi:hypothetical protein